MQENENHPSQSSFMISDLFCFFFTDLTIDTDWLQHQPQEMVQFQEDDSDPAEPVLQSASLSGMPSFTCYIKETSSEQQFLSHLVGNIRWGKLHHCS